MKNLTILNKGAISPESVTYPDLELVDSVFDVVSDSITCVLSSAESEVIEVQKLLKSGEVEVLASFNAPYPEAELLSFSHFVESGSLVFLFRNGDIISATYDTQNPDCDTTTVEIVGLISSGLLACSWSPDEETLALLTAENNLMLLSRLFEPLFEKHLNPEDIKITDAKHVSVGWGKEETQFRGKGFKALEREREALKYAGLDLKEDTPLRDPTVAEAQKGTVSSFDDNSASISWRGDCEYFAITTREIVESALEAYDRRVIRVFNREGDLDSVSEAVDGLEHNLSWRPLGSLIASAQRSLNADGEEDLQVVFFERNGLRHGEFDTRLDPNAESLLNVEWSCNSEVLALHLKDRVQLWTTKNYHWYLKQEVFVNSEDATNEVAFIKFHPEKALHLMIGTTDSKVLMLNLAYTTCNGPSVIGKDVGMTIVIDGFEAKITPLSVANVPPPISFRELDFPAPLRDIATNGSNDKYAAITSTGDLHIDSISIQEFKEGLWPTRESFENSLLANPGELVKQVSFIDDSTVAVLVDSAATSKLVLIDTKSVNTPDFIELQSKAVLIKSRSDFTTTVIECIDGSVWELSSDRLLNNIAQFPLLCPEVEVALYNDGVSDISLPFGVSVNGKLFLGEKQLATGVTSIKVTDSLLCLTTAHSQVCFVHLTPDLDNASFNFLQNNLADASDERVRQIERGSTLVSCMPSKFSVVLQAPRGNLETICPRIMVLSGVRKSIKEARYLDAFVACRTHRIDLDLLHDYDPVLFFNNVEHFINQIKRVDYLDLFVSCLKDEDVTITKYKDTLFAPEKPLEQFSALAITPADDGDKLNPRRMIINNETQEFSSKVNKICNAVLSVLSTPSYEREYLQTRITAYACQKPPNLLGALALIGSFTDKEQLEQAITHLCFLADVNKLYNHALELYDVKLTLNIAQKSQKDPKEYLPFLQNLHIQPQLRKQFLIDDHLKNHKKALQWLFEMGEDLNDEFDEYVVEHSLYQSALAIFRYNEERSRKTLHLYAAFLHEQKNFVDAALTYEYLGESKLALEDFIDAKKWKEALAIAESLGDAEVITETAQKLSTLLIDDHKYAQAAEIEYSFLGNIEEAVRLFCKNYQYESGILLAVKEKKPELIETVVDEQLGEGFGVIAELLADCKGQVTSQLKRLRELRQKKEEDPYSFYGVPNDETDTPDNVSIAASETSTAPSFFTRYTGKTAGTAKTGASRKTTKNKKREERKRAKGRKGTIYEEEYLIRSVGRLVERLDLTQVDAINLIESLIKRQRMQQAYQIQSNWVQLTAFLKDNIQEIHNMSEKDRERIDDNGEVYSIDEIPAPAIKEFPKKSMLDY